MWVSIREGRVILLGASGRFKPFEIVRQRLQPVLHRLAPARAPPLRVPQTLAVSEAAILLVRLCSDEQELSLADGRLTALALGQLQGLSVRQLPICALY